ncbi:hypothetical protein JCGZ_04871 [Jatropha curcas]|uniref:Sodium channel modifier 1 n=1 Tax=Jatropha curcas TaxID=180498 RepID=A0A067KTH2_JATCU|nr:sodium channel modifier 1 [Jatropha curcas]KDP38228.1 hypothetical protein JCGZ_04871 [Jatropha curcas]
MSVYGGDSWAREAQYRKRRVDGVLLQGLDGSSYKKLSSGKYACLVCPHNPILDTSLMLTMHSKGSRHLAAESRLKEGELKRKDVINKRLALSDSLVSSHDSTSINKKVRLASKPLLEQTKKATSEVLYSKIPQQSLGNKNCGVKLSDGQLANVTTFSSTSIKASERSLVQQQLDFRERRERELKFIEAGWKRDCHGRWFKDENVEFDSDEEDPNVCLS